MRSKLLLDLIAYIIDMEFLVLKYTGRNQELQHPASDLDLLIRKADQEQIIRYLNDHPVVKKCRIERKTYGTHLHLDLSDNDFFQIDLLYRFTRKDLQYLTPREVFGSKTVRRNIPSCDDKTLLNHLLLFNGLNYAGIPSKYLDYFRSLPDTASRELLRSLEKEFGISVSNWSELRNFDPAMRRQLVWKLRQQPANSWYRRGIRWMTYALDVIRESLSQKGFIVTFSGVDGAGKSTLLNAFADRLQRHFRRKVVILRHRPSLLPILSAWKHGRSKAEKLAVSKAPRSGNNQSRIGSTLRFLYYYLDYLIGQIYVFFKYIIRGYVVVYDRYYFDFIADPKRSNLAVSETLTRPLYRFISKPRLNVLLYHDAEVIRSRKQELPLEDIRQLTTRYRELFSQLDKNRPESYLQIRNENLQESLQILSGNYQKVA